MKNIIDFRSHFTATHSAAISTASVKIAEKIGFSDEELEFFRIAGNLHDIGKLSVPNSILEKNGRLTPEEFAVVRQHTYYTYLITKRSGFPREIVEWASFHHEKLNGNGYPFHLKDNKISLGSRIVAVADIFTALTEDRPYRLGMDTNEVLSIIKGMVDNGSLDLFVYEVLAGNIEEILFHTGKAKAEADIQYKSFMEAVQ
jgi:putative nucleotidyltransferase with HDIG domain